MSANDEPLLALIRAPLAGDGIGDLLHVADQLRTAPMVLRLTLTAILADRDRLDTVAKSSSMHPNGFAKVLPLPGTHRARLHIWPHGETGVRDDASAAHGHRWDFASWVISGTLRETMFEVDPDSVAYSEFQYGRASDHGSYLVRARAVGLTIRSERFRGAGSVYTRLGTDLHSAEPVGAGPVITFVVQGPRSATAAPVYRRPSVPHAEERSLSTDEVYELLRTVIGALDWLL